MLTKLTDQIYRLTLPHNRQTVNSYLIRGKKGFTVLDTGPNSEEVKQTWLKLMADGFAIDKVIVSHGHTDHIGLAAWFQQQVRVPVIHSRIGFDDLKAHRQRALEAPEGGNRPYSFLLQHGGPPIPEKWLYAFKVNDYFEPDDVYEPNGQVNIGDWKFQAIWTPGHAPDQFCFWHDELRILFSGDHVIGHLSPVIPTWGEEDGNPLQVYLESLQALESYRPSLVLPGHGEPIPDLQRRIAELREGHMHRLEQIAGILANGEHSAGQVTREIYNGSSQGLLAMLELSSTISRLVYMEAAGRVKRVLRDDGKVYYSLLDENIAQTVLPGCAHG